VGIAMVPGISNRRLDTNQLPGRLRIDAPGRGFSSWGSRHPMFHRIAASIHVWVADNECLLSVAYQARRQSVSAFRRPRRVRVCLRPVRRTISLWRMT
jgi:hypothetical protein